MCGFAGYIGGPSSRSDRLSILRRMGKAIAHRGSDDQGNWISDDLDMGIIHQRLSIIDLSRLGRQPMVSTSGRFVIGFNGEIYNHRALRSELEGIGACFRSETDTEVLLEGIECWGLEKTLNLSFGMFAFVLVDTELKKLYLVRDRLGEKPLYYGWRNGSLIFASELSAFRCHPNWTGCIDRNALADLVRYGYIPDPASIYTDVFKLKPGYIGELTLGQERREVRVKAWWSYSMLPEPKVCPGNQESTVDQVELLDQTLRAVLRDHSISDVPLGTFLSGGVDSSLIAATLQSESMSPLKTFTIGYSEANYDESKAAGTIAEQLGTEHTSLILNPKDVLETITKLPVYFSEPFADTSQIPTVMLSNMTREKVVVALSGDGGDELFGGYNRYVWGPRLQKIKKIMPRPLRRLLSECFYSLPIDKWERTLAFLTTDLVNSAQGKYSSEKLSKFVSGLDTETDVDLYNSFCQAWQAEGAVISGSPSDLVRINKEVWDSKRNFSEKMMLLDLLTYLPGDILVKVDRASMAHGLEVRAPFLDVRMVELAYQLPLNLKVCGGRRKVLSRTLLSRYLPESIIDRPKMGFAIPIGSWLRGPLREWVEDLLNESQLRSDGFFCEKLVRETWRQHLSGNTTNTQFLWAVLMFQAWHLNNR